MVIRLTPYLSTPPLGLDMTQGQFFKRSLTGFNSEFSFYTSCLTKAEQISLPYYLPIAGGRIIGFTPFPRVLVLCENAISLVQDLNSCRHVPFPTTDNHYTTVTSNGSQIDMQLKSNPKHKQRKKNLTGNEYWIELLPRNH